MFMVLAGIAAGEIIRNQDSGLVIQAGEDVQHIRGPGLQK